MYSPDRADLKNVSLLSKYLFLGTALGLLWLLCWNSWFGPDIWYHLRLGRNILWQHTFQFTDNVLLEQPRFINSYWLYQILQYGLFAGGSHTLIQVADVLLWTVIALLMYRTFYCRLSPPSLVAFALLAIVSLHYRFEPRPEIYSYLFLAIFLSTIHSARKRDLDRRQLGLLLATQVLWANMHGYFFLGVACVALRAADDWFNAEKARAKKMAAFAVVLFGASMLSPWGYANWLHPWYLVHTLRELGTQVHEFHSPWSGANAGMWTIWVYTAAWLGVLIATLRICIQAVRPHAYMLALATAGLIAGATSIRNIPLLFLLAGPVVLQASFTGRPNKPSSRRQTRWFLAGAVACIGLGASVIEGSFYRSIRSETGFGDFLSTYAYPIHAAEYLQKSSAAGPVFNHPSDGGYLSFQLAHLHVFGDSRFVDSDRVLEYFRATQSITAFQDLHAKIGFRGVLLKLSDNQQLIGELLSSNQWQLKYVDLHRVYLVPGGFVIGHSYTGKFYAGEDLRLRIHAWSSIQWVRMLTLLRQTQLLRELLSDLDQSPHVPSFVVEYALEYAREIGDHRLWNQVLLLRPRLFSLNAEDTRIVDSIIQQGMAKSHPP